MNNIEEALFASWPALEEESFFGWKLRFANGYTKRANSANASVRLDNLSDAQIGYIEEFFKERKQKAIFRLTSFCTSQEIDDMLADRKYRFMDLSIVMTISLANVVCNNSDKCDFLNKTSHWLSIFQKISNAKHEVQKTHLMMLDKIMGDTAYAVIEEDGKPVCCGLGVVHKELLGLYDIVAAPGWRGQGLATKICSDLMAWGKSIGAKKGYLQVVGSNSTAINLYEKLGFRRSYTYWYRVQPIEVEQNTEVDW